MLEDGDEMDSIEEIIDRLIQDTKSGELKWKFKKSGVGVISTEYFTINLKGGKIKLTRWLDYKHRSVNHFLYFKKGIFGSYRTITGDVELSTLECAIVDHLNNEILSNITRS